MPVGNPHDAGAKQRITERCPWRRLGQVWSLADLEVGDQGWVRVGAEWLTAALRGGWQGEGRGWLDRWRVGVHFINGR
jgi:hypothetical protein